MKTETQFFVVKSHASPTVTIDPDVDALYIYFKRCKVHRTIPRPSKNMILNVDLDERGDVVGIEAIGAGQIEVGQLLKKAKVQAPRIDWSHMRIGQPAHA